MAICMLSLCNWLSVRLEFSAGSSFIEKQISLGVGRSDGALAWYSHVSIWYHQSDIFHRFMPVLWCLVVYEQQGNNNHSWPAAAAAKQEWPTTVGGWVCLMTPIHGIKKKVEGHWTIQSAGGKGGEWIWLWCTHLVERLRRAIKSCFRRQIDIFRTRSWIGAHPELCDWLFPSLRSRRRRRKRRRRARVSEIILWFFNEGHSVYPFSESVIVSGGDGEMMALKGKNNKSSV